MSEREMSEQSTQFSIGQLIGSNAQRDAIHVAVAPVVAVERLAPGQHIAFIGSGREMVGAHGEHIGIVDPFLPGPVFKGDRFWMFLYPNTIQSLRHQWTHPSFDSQAQAPRSQNDSEKWLRDFCDTHDCPKYETIIAAILGQEIRDGDIRYSIDGDYFHFDGVDAHSEIPPEFWDHIEVVTGKKIIGAQRPTNFSCSC